MPRTATGRVTDVISDVPTWTIINDVLNIHFAAGSWRYSTSVVTTLRILGSRR